MDNAISNGDGVVLSKGSSHKFIRVKPGRKERMENFNVFCDDLIGSPYGAAFKVNGRQLIRIDARELDDEDERDDEKAKDNRNIIDDCSAQKMSRDEIMKLKEAGKDGVEIIEKIIDNSATFKDKNVYSQAKYLKKKKKKHLAHFITHKPTARLLCELFFKKSAAKILEMRPDTLAQLLTWSNVRSGTKVLLAETCQGLLLGAILERLGSSGQIVQAYPGTFPVRVILNKFNFLDSLKANLISGFSLECIEDIKKSLVDANGEDSPETMIDSGLLEDCNHESDIRFNENVANKDKIEISTENDDIPKEEQSEVHQNPDEVPCNAMYTKEKRLAEEKQALPYLKMRNFNSLIIATKFHPKNLMIELLDFLEPSSPIVIYCQYKEPLMECYEHLRDESLAVNVVLTDTWFREIQVLPNRTHPEITMSARGGYLLRGIKVRNNCDGCNEKSEPSLKKQKRDH